MRKFSNIVRVLCIIIPALAFAWSTSCGGAASVLISIAVTPAAPSVAAGATQQFTATGTRADGSTVDITATVTWTSSDEAVAAFETPDTSGLATAIAAGTATISATDADTGISGSTDMTVAALSGTIKNLYTNNTNWNDYLANDGADIFTATDTACNPASGTWYNDCLNGGFFRSVEVTGRGVCAGLTATDSLGAFNWACDSNTNDVSMVSVGFADGMGLSDLIDFDTATWKQLNVTVLRGGNPYLATDMASLWSNTIVVNNTGAAMNTEGEVHIVTVSNPDEEYVIGADKIALLIKPGILAKSQNPGGEFIEVISRNFIWIEGRMDVVGYDYGIYLETIQFSQLRNVRVQNAQEFGNDIGIYIDSSSKNKFSNMVAANNNEDGVVLTTSTNNILTNILASNNGSDGVSLDADDNILTTITSSSHNNFDLEFNGANNNVVANTTAANGEGVESALSSNNTIMNLASFNEINDGIELRSNSNNTTLANIAVAFNADDGIALDTSSNNYFTGLVKVGNNSDDNCFVTGAVTDPGIDNSCNPQGPESDFGSALPIADISNTFIAKASSDSVNPDGATGTKAVGSITDWVNFENMFRGWGNNGGDFPASDNRDPCTAGTCRIWDWSLASADTVIRDVLALPTGDDTLTHNWTIGSVTFLRNAIEILDDGIGNENGLCESNETCLYTPNIGSYQGHGNLISAGDFTDGTITGVTLMQYETNGR